MHYSDTRNPTPQEINTDDFFMNVCEGMVNGSEREATVRVFCLAAKQHNKWNLTQEELDERDKSGTFYWNGMVEAGWFEPAILEHAWVPTAKMFGALMSNGLIEYDLTDYENEDEGEFDEEEKPQLKLFRCNVTYAERSSKHSYFTVLDVDELSAKKTCIARVKKLKQLNSRRGGIGRVDVTEVEGPFEAGQILHEER